jgi:hypothetical protein
MRKTLNCICIAVIVLFGYPITALAEPVTKSDLAGKNICWRDGRTTFGKEGSFYSTRFAHGTWSLTGDRLVVTRTKGGFVATITKTSTRRTLVSAPPMEKAREGATP